MKRLKQLIQAAWFILAGLASPLWAGCIYMNLTGHGKGYGYDMGPEADIAVFFGVLLLLLWLAAVLPVTFSLCRQCRSIKRPLTWLPLLAFAALFAIGICILGWKEFTGLFMWVEK